MTPHLRLILASNNAKKLRELQSLLGPLGLDLINQGALGIPEAEEPHVTFVENALAKARHAAQASKGAAIADDSGLCVRALGGLPGVRSARYAQDAGRHPAGVPREAADAANNALLLETMQGKAERHAHFTCLLVAVRHAEDPEPLIAEGHWAGQLVDSVGRGTEGFGYDPLLWLPDHGCTAAEMSAEQKNAISHRAIACRRMRELMALHWGLRA
ncbi:MAG TPA: RdgB/HAM1 family non-canonical purine NTP pyrophosphatase [Candidatus Aquabacterium excrementipullorum]|nr:RdgB/HAM1 family non-canonical purine NTP pyrophosphatase [Candidatus Aquabacterium excrementipullorum]